MKDKKVTFETAKLAKELGFDEYCQYYFDVNGKEKGFSGYDYMKKLNTNSMVHLIDTNTEEFEYPDVACTQPTQSLLQRWLREIMNVYVYVQCPHFNHHRCKIRDFERDFLDRDTKSFDTYEEALEAGLLSGLNLIKEYKK